MSSLRVSEISLSYHDQRVLEDLTFSLEEGEIGCLLGASGCGKTSALRCIAGLERTTRGTIHLDGRTLSDAQTHVVASDRGVGMVFQDYALFPHLNVASNVEFGLTHLNAAERRSRVREVLASTQLDDLANRFPHALSGGQQQRVALARALAPRPKLILLDEPFSHLDRQLSEALRWEVRRVLKQSKTTTLLVTHDQEEAFELSDKLGVMKAGRVLQWDTPYQVFHVPRSRYVTQFLGAGHFLPGRVVRTNPLIVESEFGEHPAQATGEPSQGDSIDVLIRPEAVVLSEGSTLRGRILRTRFKGFGTLVEIETPKGSAIAATVGHSSAPFDRKEIGIELTGAPMIFSRLSPN